MRATAIASGALRRDHALLRLITCGSADDDKSSLIQRLRDESKPFHADPCAGPAVESHLLSTEKDSLGFALLLDSVAAREPGIDVHTAYRFFAFGKPRFIMADAAGHEQSIRNMLTGAPTADVATVLIDARKGMETHTRRHTRLVSLLGIHNVAVAVDKLDLVGCAKEVFDRVEVQYRAFAQVIGLRDVACIPVSVSNGDNVATRSSRMPWYRGPTLIEYLATAQVEVDATARPFRMVIERDDRTNGDFHGFRGRVLSGAVQPGDRLRVIPSGHESTAARLVVGDADERIAVTGQSITLTLVDDIDAQRGDMLAPARRAPGVADQFEATIIWLANEPMLPGRGYWLRSSARTVGATLAPPKYRLNIDSLEHIAARTLRRTEIGVCNLHLDQPIAFDPYAENRDTGGFILIDRFTNDMIGAGLIHFALRRSQNIHWQAIDVDKHAHTALKGHRPCVVWFTGLSGAGKSTIANRVEARLHAMGLHTCLLDGDNVRHGLNQDLGFTEADRVENIRRVAEVARLMVAAGLIVLVSFISPFRAERRFARGLVEAHEFCEVFVDAPLDVAESRDRKGLYAKARCGELVNFTGIDSPYEKPEQAEVSVDTTQFAPDAAADLVIAQLQTMGVFDAPVRGAA